MCIIAYKSEGVAMPSKQVLQNCFDNNNDGAGFMYLDRVTQKVIIDKGYMSWKPFWKAICEQGFSKKDVVVMHFRFATAGLTCAGNTHPFPVTQDTDQLTMLWLSTELAVVHNGIFGKGEGDMSDTMVYVRDIFAEPCVRDNIDNYVMQTLLCDYTHGSKLAFMREDGSVYLFGEFIKHKGVHYSNDDYKRKWWSRYGTGTKVAHKLDNPQWYAKREDQAAPCNTCTESTCTDCDYWEYLKSGSRTSGMKKGSQDYAPACPTCQEFDDIISDYHGVYECMDCGSVYDINQKIIATTFPQSTKYTTQHTGDDLPCNTCDVRNAQECVDCEKWHA